MSYEIKSLLGKKRLLDRIHKSYTETTDYSTKTFEVEYEIRDGGSDLFKVTREYFGLTENISDHLARIRKQTEERIDALKRGKTKTEEEERKQSIIVEEPEYDASLHVQRDLNGTKGGLELSCEETLTTQMQENASKFQELFPEIGVQGIDFYVLNEGQVSVSARLRLDQEYHAAIHHYVDFIEGIVSNPASIAGNERLQGNFLTAVERLKQAGISLEALKEASGLIHTKEESDIIATYNPEDKKFTLLQAEEGELQQTPISATNIYGFVYELSERKLLSFDYKTFRERRVAGRFGTKKRSFADIRKLKPKIGKGIMQINSKMPEDKLQEKLSQAQMIKFFPYETPLGKEFMHYVVKDHFQ